MGGREGGIAEWKDAWIITIHPPLPPSLPTPTQGPLSLPLSCGSVSLLLTYQDEDNEHLSMTGKQDDSPLLPSLPPHTTITGASLVSPPWPSLPPSSSPTKTKTTTTSL